jgi:TolA-binding protein
MKPLRNIRALCVSAVALTWAAGVYAADAPKAGGQSCWSSEAEKNLASCPGSGPTTFNVGTHGKQPRVRFKSAPEQVDLKKRDAKAKPGGPSTEMDSFAIRDQRQEALKPRVRALLITEIQGLEQLFQTTPRRAPDRVRIARRLAETYVELENAARRDKTQAEVKKNTAEVKKAGQVMLLARQKAISFYNLIKTQYPSYKQLDEVLYYLAYEYEQAEDLVNARKVYYELIQKTPNSKYIPSAYLAFGELFFGEAQSDASKFELAKQAYTEVIKYPPPDNKMFGYAHYKLAYVNWNQEDFPRSLTHFKKTIEFADQYPTLPNAGPLAAAARKDLVPVYALSGRPEAAYGFFKGLSGDKPNDDAKTFDMMDALGQNYLDTGYYAEAITLYQDLMRRDKGPRYCQYHARISEATLAMKSGNKDLIKKALDGQVAVFKEFKGTSHTGDSQLKCANATAGLLSETAMAWHLEAVGSGGVRGTNDPKTMALADYLYGQVVDNFSAQDFAKFEFPRIAKEDWPTIYKIKYHRADLLYAQKKWDECGPAFDAVVAENPTSAEAPEAAFAAVLCYQNIYDEEHKGGKDRKGGGHMPGGKKDKKDEKASEADKYKKKDFTDRQKGMITAFNRYVCYIKPADSDKEGKNQYVEVKYARARTYFEAQHWEEAALAFRDVAINHADHEAGIFAAQLYLESINVLGDKIDPPRPDCFDKMGEDVPKLIGLYCTGARAAANEDQCAVLTRIQCDIERLKAENMVKIADKGGAGALRQYEAAANAYLGLWRKYGEDAVKNNKELQCERLDEVVYNACKAFQAGRLVAKAIQCRQILLNPDNKMTESPLARKAVYEIGGNYQAIAVYDKAADWYEKFAREKPKPNAKESLDFWNEKADTALSDSVVLRLGLGHDTKALENAKLFQQFFGARKPVQNAQIAFAIASYYVEQKKWDDARNQLTKSMALIDKHAAYDVRVQAHAMLGNIYVQMKREGSAVPEYKKVADLWANPKQAADKVMEDAKDESESGRIRRLGKALTAVGEALFFFAEEKRRKTVDPIKFPEYTSGTYKPSTKKVELMDTYEFEEEMGKRKKESENVKKHIDTKVKDWVEKKKAAIEAADQEYLKILKLEPTPPPQWVIAAGAAVGTMWAEFVADFRRAPLPAWMKSDDELRGVYYQNLDAASEPVKQRAKAAFTTCLGLSVKHQYFDRYSRSCEEWLAENYKAEFHKVDEFRGSPDLVGSGLNDKPYPLQLGGEPYVVAPVATKEEEGKK